MKKDQSAPVAHLPGRINVALGLGALLLASGCSGAMGSWPTEEEMRPLVEQALIKNISYQECASAIEFGTGRKVGGPALKSFSVVKKGNVEKGVYPAMIEATYLCDPTQTFGSSPQQEKISTKSMRVLFRKDEFGTWQSLSPQDGSASMP
ncbi:hypothetical protein [Sphingomonas sp.]|jgi:hypothetical protein|uniref:hypothetical protein n=1 Tax=Sphingomonas sp. TaxID=28214 RepID=UPI002ED8FF66